MEFFFIVLIGGLAIAGARWVFGCWTNHVVVYLVMWVLSLLLFQMRLFSYYPLQPETWIVIIAGTFSFLLGALMPGMALYAGSGDMPRPRRSTEAPSSFVMKRRQKILRIALYIANVISFGGALQQWFIVIRKFGSVFNVLALGNLLYSYRVAEGALPGTIPYVSSLALTGAVLAGLYTAMTGTLKPAAVVPLIVQVMLSMANMGRSGLILAAVLFLSSYSLCRLAMPLPRRSARTGRLKRLLAVSAVVILLALGTEFVRSGRGAVENFAYQGQALTHLRTASFITPSVYLYLTVHFGVLNQYLIQDVEHTPWGSNTFAPLYRLLAKAGLGPTIPWYPRFYHTPVGANTGTYLRELHADFGILGIFAGPFLLGLLGSLTWYRYLATHSYVLLTVGAYLGVIVVMSIFYIVLRGGDFVLSFFPAAAAGFVLNRVEASNGPRSNPDSRTLGSDAAARAS